MRTCVRVRCRATILHADLDAFYASVEQRDDPRLRGRPVIVGGGVVLAASYEAKARGVRTAMGERQARALCPSAVVVPPRMEAYSAASRAVFDVFRRTSPLVEGLSIDEAFLEVGGLARVSGTPTQIAVRPPPTGARGGRPAHHGGGGGHQVPGQGGQRGGQARRAAGGAGRRGARLPAPAAGRAAVGGGAHHRREAPRPWAAHRGPGGRARRGRPGGHVGAGLGPPPPRPGPQPRSPTGAHRRPAPVDGRAVRAGSWPAHPGPGRRGGGGPGRPGDPPDARRRSGRSHGHAAAALRRLHPGHALAHARRGHRPDRAGPGRHAVVAGRRRPADPRPGA